MELTGLIFSTWILRKGNANSVAKKNFYNGSNGDVVDLFLS
jgi:hypothetical protein